MPSPTTYRLLAAAILVGTIVAAYFGANGRTSLPPGIASGNGRLEATEVDVASKSPGRLLSVRVREGDAVEKGQVLAEMDVEDLKAEFRAAEAGIRQAMAAAAEARTLFSGAKSAQDIAAADLGRTRALAGKGFVSRERLDHDENRLQVAKANAEAARNRTLAAEEAVAAARARSEAIRTALDDAALRAPVSGRVLYRLAEPGEVLAAGGKALTLIDLSEIYIPIYLPALEAGRVALGSPARILLDALPDAPIPGRVTYVSPRAQFTPKEVETRNEREKLMFRIKIEADPGWVKAHSGLAKPGMPGTAYVLTEPDAAWPSVLTTR